MTETAPAYRQADPFGALPDAAESLADPDTLDLFGDARAERLVDDLGRWPAQLTEMTALLQAELEQGGLGEPDARRLACRQICRFVDEYGGSHPYIPKGDAIRRALRDLRIWGEHDGTVDGPRGIRALSREYRLSEVTVYAILRAQRRLHVQRVQGRLF